MRKSYIYVIASTLIVSLVGVAFRLSFADEGINLLKRLEGNFGISHIIGSFSASGNAGKLIMLNTTQEGMASGSGLYLNTADNTLVGQFYSETVGYIELGVPGYPVILTPPAGTSVNIMQPWKVSGYAWSENSGWISLDSVDGTYGGVYYLPTSQTLDGYAWSDTLGFLSFSDSNNLNFLGKVKVLGSIGGDKSFNILYALGGRINSASHTQTLNSVRKSVALAVRSAPSTSINTTNVFSAVSDIKNVTNDIVYFKLKASDSGKYISIGSASDDILKTKNARSLIIEGGDLYIKGDIMENIFLNKSRSIIVIKDSLGNGGNIYIDGSVKKIYSSIVAEGTIYSGYPSSLPNVSPVTTFLYNDTKDKVTNLPANQLYIYGSVMSKNTIGGSAETESGNNGSCPYTESNCNRDTAIKYDLNYFRGYNKEATRRAYKDDTLDDYSVIIESDPSIIANPPPGLLSK